VLLTAAEQNTARSFANTGAGINTLFPALYASCIARIAAASPPVAKYSVLQKLGFTVWGDSGFGIKGLGFRV